MMTEKIICPECGAENPENATFCEVCHTPLQTDEQEQIIGPQHPDQDDFDLLKAAEDDLPGLLHALKQEQEEDDLSAGESISGEETPPLEPEDMFDSSEDQVGDEIPDWLHRIRQRASSEDDSAGEITQKISAAKESLAGEKRSSQHESFESWIQKLRGPVGGGIKQKPEEETELEAAEDEDEVLEPREPDWLQKIRQAEGKTASKDLLESIDDGKDGSLNWLVSLEKDEEESPEERESGEEIEEILDESTQQVETDGSGVTQEVAVEDEPTFEVIPPKLQVTPEEKTQAEKLASMIMDEAAPRPIRKLKRRSPLGSARFFFAILLIASMGISLFLGQRGSIQLPVIGPHSEGFLSWARNIPEGSSHLVVFDYQPAFSSEINLIAPPVLELLAEKESNISVISSSLSGPVLYRQLFKGIGAMEEETIVDLGYFPIGAYGAFDLGMGFSPNWVLAGLPESAKNLPEDGFDGILILADTYEGARAWIEQLTILIPDTPINLLVTDQATPMLIPYFDSGQIMGMVSGLNGSAILETELSNGSQAASRWWAYQIGLFLLMGVMVVGAIYAGNQHKEEGGEK
jgi:hypothetical protein